MYDAICELISKIDSIVDWLEHVPCQDKNEEFYIDMVQTRLDETKEECIWMLKILGD